jgi:hypothetical protein
MVRCSKLHAQLLCVDHVETSGALGFQGIKDKRQTKDKRMFVYL